MKKLLTGVIAAIALSAAFTSTASASTACRISGYDVNRSGYGISYAGARASGMNCASVRYAHKVFRSKLRRQYGYPRLARPFFDGWVTWHCYKASRHGIRCAEGTSGTSYSFRAYVN